MTESEQEKGIRLNKYLSEAGVCSRREADRRIAAGRVAIDGRTAGVGDRVFPGQSVTMDRKPVSPEEQEILLMFHKPAGIVVTSEVRKGVTNVEQFLKYPKRVFPIGRLDKDSEGLLLLTNNGAIVNRILRAGNAHEKEYTVRVDRPVTEDFLARMREGVPILDTVTLPCRAEKMGKYTFRIVLTQGLNRQIRRMCEACGYRVLRLKRLRIMNLELGDLPCGAVREASENERAVLASLLAGSTNAPYGKRD